MRQSKTAQSICLIANSKFFGYLVCIIVCPEYYAVYLSKPIRQTTGQSRENRRHTKQSDDMSVLDSRVKISWTH